ncbi:hypothetical protein [Flavobacterium beibuense]|uniref:hypothetical protein n=1 Tax=Flavobacterium beibuense TaxID=657326 RepID=UPI003A8E2C63
MKIELKLTADELQYLDSVLEDISLTTIKKFMFSMANSKLMLSVMIDVADKVIKKYQGLSRKVSLFDAKKKHKVEFKYHEASALCSYLVGLRPNEVDPYRKSIVTKLTMDLSQKLQ